MKKITFILLSALLLNACATIKTKESPLVLSKGREAPSFFAHEETAAGFRVRAQFKDTQVEGTLLLRKRPDGTMRVRLMGPMMGAVIADAVLTGDELKFDYILPDFNSAMVKSRLEKFILILVKAPGEVKKAKVYKDGLLEIHRAQAGGTGKYSYQYDNAYPHALVHGSMAVQYLDYRSYKDSALSYNISVKDSLSDIIIELDLLSIN